MSGSLQEIGFVATYSDLCVYMLHSGDDTVILTLYVDDILVAGGSQELLNHVKRQLMERYDMPDMVGEMRYVLGMNVSRNIEKGKL